MKHIRLFILLFVLLLLLVGCKSNELGVIDTTELVLEESIESETTNYLDGQTLELNSDGYVLKLHPSFFGVVLDSNFDTKKFLSENDGILDLQIVNEMFVLVLTSDKYNSILEEVKLGLDYAINYILDSYKDIDLKINHTSYDNFLVTIDKNKLGDTLLVDIVSSLVVIGNTYKEMNTQSSGEIIITVQDVLSGEILYETSN